MFRVRLQGREVGPYDRRTIVGMRIKEALTSDDLLVASDGSSLTVADLLRTRPHEGTFQPNKTATYSLVQATYSASLLAVHGKGAGIPAFQGEIEARIQTDVLRMAGRFRKGLRWKDDRIKLPLADIVHARVRNSIVDLWLRKEGAKSLQRVTLELFTPEAAGEFVDWLPNATPSPQGEGPAVPGSSQPFVWLALIGTALIVVGVLVMLLARRAY